MNSKRFFYILKRYTTVLAGMLLLLSLNACNVKKYIPADQKLYTGAEVKLKAEEGIKGKNQLQYAIEEVIEPSPNKKIFGIRYGLYFHYKAQQPGAGKIIQNLNKRFGEEPVYLSSVNLQHTEGIINNRCENRGFFYSRISSTIEEDKRTGSAKYKVEVSEPYVLETYVYNRDSSAIDILIRKSMEDTELDKGTRFDTEKFKAERTRINDYLKDRGYYEFNPDFLIFTSDTNQYDTRKYDLYLDFKEAAPREALRPYRIRNISVYPNYNMEISDTATMDSVMVDDISFLQKQLIFKPRLLRPYITFAPGELYDRRETEVTTKRLSSIGTFQLVSVRYDRADTTDFDPIGELDASVLLSPGKRQAVRVEVQTVTKSNSFAGPGVIGSYQNKNLFRGGERLDISGNVSYETQLARGSAKNLSTFEFKALTSITFPRLIAPFKIDPQKGYSIPNTKFSVNYTLQRRAKYYNLNSILFSYGYNWKSNRFIYQELNPISINYTSVPDESKSEEFKKILADNPFLARSFESQFIPGLTYTFQYSEIGEPDKKNRFYFNFGADLAGNTFGLIQKTFDTDTTFLGLPFAQYLRGDIDFRHYLNVWRESRVVSRLFIGAGFPYGNSRSLPFVKQYFAGGPNSIRAFRVRSVGPGSYKPPQSEDNLTYFDQSGDIRLEANLELRHPIVSLLKGAVFTDAGNIWLMNENPAIPGGKFSESWTQEIAMGVGYGFRLDIDFLVIRLDISFPIRYPYMVEESHWQTKFAFGQQDWRRQNLVWNFAIGYPF